MREHNISRPIKIHYVDQILTNARGEEIACKIMAQDRVLVSLLVPELRRLSALGQVLHYLDQKRLPSRFHRALNLN